MATFFLYITALRLKAWFKKFVFFQLILYLITDSIKGWMEKSTDKELMNLVLKRNTRAFKVLYQRYELAIFNFIFRYTSNREIAQDLLQETFTRVWFAAHLFDYEGGNFRGWLYTIALNTTRNEMSKKRYSYQYFEVSEIKGAQEPVLPEKEHPIPKWHNLSTLTA